jgi:hypothetical protein
VTPFRKSSFQAVWAAQHASLHGSQTPWWHADILRFYAAMLGITVQFQDVSSSYMQDGLVHMQDVSAEALLHVLILAQSDLAGL